LNLRVKAASPTPPETRKSTRPQSSHDKNHLIKKIPKHKRFFTNRIIHPSINPNEPLHAATSPAPQVQGGHTDPTTQLTHLIQRMAGIRWRM